MTLNPGLDTLQPALVPRHNQIPMLLTARIFSMSIYQDAFSLSFTLDVSIKAVRSHRTDAVCMKFTGMRTVPVIAQRTIHVPGDASSIQQAINASSNGDALIIASGTKHKFSR
jgi:hypothetical protein